MKYYIPAFIIALLIIAIPLNVDAFVFKPKIKYTYLSENDKKLQQEFFLYINSDRGSISFSEDGFVLGKSDIGKRYIKNYGNVLNPYFTTKLNKKTILKIKKIFGNQSRIFNFCSTTIAGTRCTHSLEKNGEKYTEYTYWSREFPRSKYADFVKKSPTCTLYDADCPPLIPPDYPKLYSDDFEIFKNNLNSLMKLEEINYIFKKVFPN